MIIWSGLDKLSSTEVLRASKEEVGVLSVLQQALISSDTFSAAISACGITARRVVPPQPGNLPLVGLISPSHEHLLHPEQEQTYRVGRDTCLLHPWS